MHIEAGLRSNEINMPEEQNRYISDFLSDYLVTPTKSSINNLKLKKYNKKIFNFGDVMYDSILFYKKFINKVYSDNFKRKYNHLGKISTNSGARCIIPVIICFGDE